MNPEQKTNPEIERKCINCEWVEHYAKINWCPLAETRVKDSTDACFNFQWYLKDREIQMDDDISFIVFCADETGSPLLWGNDITGIGNEEEFYIGHTRFSLSHLKGLHEWLQQADKYFPYTIFDEFTTDGMEEWIRQGYKYAKQISKMIPRKIDFYYAFWIEFGDKKWYRCKALII